MLGAEPRAGGTTFEVASSVADRIELCLFDADGNETERVDLRGADGTDLWSVHVAGVGPGQQYGFRVHGPGEPAKGHACDPAKLLVDPAARRVVGEVRWAPELAAPGVDSAPFVPRSVVVAPPTERVERLASPVGWDRALVYEAHVGHLTHRHPLVPAAARGRYAGLGDPAVIDHLHRLGITAVELLPVQHFVSEPGLIASGQRNVWGYNPLAWGAAHSGYASPGGDPVAELRAAIAALHEAGIEVWLDVVFNHTCEGALGRGPILSWRGFDNAATYRLRSTPQGLVDDDVTGCGNAVDAGSPLVRRLVRQLLVRWVAELGVDGFRFDLAATLARGADGPTPDAPLLAELASEPGLDGVRLVAEPWDVGPGGYQVGRFPVPWREWNDRFRDDVRRLWLDGPVDWSLAATRLTASADLFGDDALDRPATTSINAVATHDGFTTADLVTWSAPVEGGHPQASTNSGLEGPTTDPAVTERRRRRQRALLGTVLCAQGVPMLNAGDELGRSQGGRADGYTLEPAEGGLPWPEADWDLVAWCAEAARLRHAHPALRRASWVDPGDEAVTWLKADGTPFVDGDWTDPAQHALQVLLAPPTAADAALLLVVLPHDEVELVLPPGTWWVHLDARWRRPRAAEDEPWEGTTQVDGPTFVVLADRP